MTRLGSALGTVAGVILAPVAATVSFVRRARTFHPRGPSYHATVSADPAVDPAMRAIAQRLDGPALVRFSAAIFKHMENVPDVLGLAIRFRRTRTDDSTVASDDQDLLFATILRPYTMGIAPFTTRISDFLDNRYYSVSPFDAGARRPIYLRVHSSGGRDSRHVGPREVRLDRGVESGEVRLALMWSHSPYRGWKPLASIAVDARAEVDGEALRFSPYHAGRGFAPSGFVHGLRRTVYPASQATRPREGRARQRADT